MMKKGIALLLASALALSMIGCGGAAADAGAADATQTATEEVKEADVPAADVAEEVEAASVELNVTTTFAGEDGNAQNFKNAVDAWCAETGNTVADTSATS
ncbi:MAG: ABC transporter substrate-binding protein, partial [Lachnospiraceae bacterium]|nr:ABC transporter substrate-binding protein [Lachnospiraceae bacterium]